MSVGENNRRIARNTAILYLRMLFVMFVSFFTTRITLKILGVEDYGLQNAIGGVVSMFTFVTATLSAACSRYYSIELGRGDNHRLNQVFSMMLFLYALTGIVLVLLLETVGLWYLLHKVVCAPERMRAAFWFFQFIIGAMIFGLVSVPYSALITAHEHMSLLAWLSIIDISLKLLAVVSLMFVPDFDLLICYGCLLLTLSFVVAALHVFVCRIRYRSVCRIKFFFEKKLFVELLTFNWWNMFGTFAWSTSETFVNLLLNSFFGPVVNAARSVAMQLLVGVTSLTHNFMTATKPQIIKYWAANDRKNFALLINRSSRLGYFLVFFFALPLYAEVETFMGWWLEEIPGHALAFTRIVLCTTLINSFSFPITTGAQAVGKLALFEGIGSGSRLLVWPISWVWLKYGGTPEDVFIVALLVTVICVLLRAIFLCRLSGMSLSEYVIQVFGRVILFSVLAAAPVICVSRIMEQGFLNFTVTGSISVITTIFAMLVVLLDVNERKKVLGLVETKCEVIVRRLRCE